MLVELHNREWLDKQIIAGKCISNILSYLSKLIAEQTPSLCKKDLEAEADNLFNKWECDPTFYKYKGFPSLICCSVNKEMVHGICGDYKFQPGDIVKIDLGATYDTAIADAARTVIYGQPLEANHLELVETCGKALDKGIAAVKVGKQIGAIGFAISKYVKDNSRFGLITSYGGHSISPNRPHAPPFIGNKARPDEGVRMQSGMTLCIEPQLTLKDTITSVSKEDGWTVSTKDLSAHFEDTIVIYEDRVENITK